MFKLTLLSLVLAFVALEIGVEGLTQQITLYQNPLPGEDSLDNTFNFTSAVANIQEEFPLVGRIRRVCVVGIWNIYYQSDYEERYATLGDFLSFNDIVCHIGDWLEPIKSISHYGGGDAREDALSLHPKTDLEGKGFILSESGNLPEPMYSLSGTGSESWLLFEEPDFQGRSLCFIVPNAPNLYYSLMDVRESLLSKVQSVFKRCKDFDPRKHRL